jgi:nitrite reductase/ring-hydroxylating ferredoxin subunit
VQEVFNREAGTQPVPSVLLSESPEFLGLEDVSVDRYISREWHDREVQKMWRKVWQMACREEDIPNVGDTLVYDIADDSILLVRTASGRIKGYYNACLHRGTQLSEGPANVNCLRCPFHGWTWSLEGALDVVTCEWDFPQVDRDSFRLPEVLVGTWDGWVFINMDLEAGPLDDYLGVLPEHFKSFPLGERYKRLHVMAKVPCNWKIAMEAFVEAYHVTVVHPQLFLTIGDCNSQYDIYGENVSRMLSLMGVPSPNLGEFDDEQAVVDSYIGDLMMVDPSIAKVTDGRTSRDVISDVLRAGLSQMYNVDMTGKSNPELLDVIEYGLFPNFIPWGGDGFPLVYRYRPNGNDPDSSILDVMMMAPVPEGPRPPAAKPQWLTGDGTTAPDWREVPEAGAALCAILNQDMANLPRIQRGLKTSRKGVTLGAYQEVRIRHFAQTLQKYLDA